MKNIFILISLFIASNALAAGSTPTESQVRDLLNSGRPGAIQLTKLGTQLVDKKVQVLKAVYDFSVLGGASGSTFALRDEGGKTATLPDNAVVTKVIFDVITQPVGVGASVAFGLDTPAANLKAATAVGSWTGLVAGIPVGTAATSIKTSAITTVKALITGNDLSNGKINAFIEYYVSD